MESINAVAEHYKSGNLLKLILAGLTNAGIDPKKVTLDELGKVDEFHVGGRKGSEHFFAQLGFEKGTEILDVGCGTGGSARYAAATYGVSVTGIDLTEEFVATGNEISRWVDMDEDIVLQTGNATAMGFADERFDGAYTMHVCMNIEDKAAVFGEVFRTLKPGSVFGIYDIMKFKAGDINYPVPWSSDESTSFPVSSDTYVDELEKEGFRIEKINNRHDFAIEFFENVKAGMAGAAGPPPLGIHIHMGNDAPLKVSNLTDGLSRGVIAPFEIVARKP